MRTADGYYSGYVHVTRTRVLPVCANHVWTPWFHNAPRNGLRKFPLLGSRETACPRAEGNVIDHNPTLGKVGAKMVERRASD